ncbi:50S ribosomal protein L24 [Candidatus Saccharibacteria bacterium CPR2]|nr:50S ribosomal protein L24 [Candidatus Saccharibacteria bacterium CPR2]
MKIKKGDTVVVITGKYKGKSGKVSEVLPKLNKIVVDGINISKRHKKPSGNKSPGGVFELTRPIDVSNVGIIHPTNKKRTSRVGYKIDDKGKKHRVYKQVGNKEIK